PCDCYRRSQSIVPQQAFVMTNSKLSLDESRVLARKLTGDESAFVTAAFEQVLSRQPSPREQTLCQEFLHRQEDLFRRTTPLLAKGGDATVPPSQDPPLRARESLVRALFNHEEFITIR